MHGKLSAEWILQWITYHHYLAQGRGHFFFYNLGGLAELDKPQFQQFLDAGLLSITDILDPTLTSDYPTWYYHQVLFINDCLHRSRFMAEHVFFIDYDEFVQVLDSPATPSSSFHCNDSHQCNPDDIASLNRSPRFPPRTRSRDS